MSHTTQTRLLSERTQARYGLGFWLHPTGSAVKLVGGDAGVSFLSVHQRRRGETTTALGNTAEGVWRIARLLDPQE